MTDERRTELQEKLDDAIARGDTQAERAIKHTIQRETLECTTHTAERIKKVERTVDEVKKVVYEMRDERTTHSRLVKFTIEIIRITVSAGGVAGVLKVLGGSL